MIINTELVKSYISDKQVRYVTLDGVNINELEIDDLLWYPCYKGHTASDWIVDIEPTTVSEGSKHKECTVCGEVLETETIHQLPPLTFTYIDGSVKDGYSVSATDTSVSGDITIPSEEDYVEVISIEDYAFRNCANLTSVVIPNSVTSIGKDAFYNCDKLTHIYYCGTEAEWDSVTIGYNDEYSRLALSGRLYFLCDEHPIYAPSSDDDVSTYGFRGYWHYVDGVPTAWCYELAYLEEVAPTCTKTGLTDGYYCTICGTVLVEQEEVAATGHDWEAYIIKPTCTEQGYTLYACKNSILHNYKDNYTDALGHTWADATCDEPRTCSVCGYTEGSATGHSWNAPTYTWADDYLTCTAIRVCSNNSSHTETATATIASKVTTAATCTTAGVRTYTATFSESWAATQTTTATIDATGHSWSKTTYTWDGTSSCTASRYCLNDTSHTEIREGTVGYAVTKAASCTDTGIGTYTAKFTASVGGSDWALEDQTKTVTIAATGHKYSRVVTPPTCTAKGYTTYTCSVCNHVYTDNEVAATGHSFTPATCTIPKTCKNCGLTEGQAVGHSWVAATCTEPKTCSTCGATEGSALGHTWGAWTIKLKPTCTTNGRNTRKCKVCNAPDVQIVPATGHTSVNYPTVAATCTTAGYTGGTYCSTCNTVLTERTTLPAIGHIATDWIIDTEPTIEAEGSQHKKCTVCGAVLETATIPKLDNNTYLVTESGEFLTDEQGNKLIL